MSGRKNEEDKTDFTSPKFNALTALYSRNVRLPNPRAPALDNMSRFLPSTSGVMIRPPPVSKICFVPRMSQNIYLRCKFPQTMQCLILRLCWYVFISQTKFSGFHFVSVVWSTVYSLKCLCHTCILLDTHRANGQSSVSQCWQCSLRNCALPQYVHLECRCDSS